MLVLTRGLGQEIVVGENADIVFQILKISGNQVRIGITAAKGTPINRREIYNLIQTDKEKNIDDVDDGIN